MNQSQLNDVIIQSVDRKLTTQWRHTSYIRLLCSIIRRIATQCIGYRYSRLHGDTLATCVHQAHITAVMKPA